jgi:large subunit ribosomal protein L35
VPKMKTHKGTAKRIKITGSGKLMYRKPVPKRMRRNKRSLYEVRGMMEVHPTVARSIRANLPTG